MVENELESPGGHSLAQKVKNLSNKVVKCFINDLIRVCPTITLLHPF